MYAIYLADEGETELPRYLSLSRIMPAANATVSLVGGPALEWEKSGSGFVARIPDGIRAPNALAWVFRISQIAR